MPYLGRLAGRAQRPLRGRVHVFLHVVRLHHPHDHSGHPVLARRLLLHLHVRLQAHLLPIHEHPGRHCHRG